MSVSIAYNPLNDIIPVSVDLKFDEPFAQSIQKDGQLYFHIETFLKVAPVQLKRIEDLYYYEKLEMGDLLEEVAERPVQVTVQQAKGMVKAVAKCSFFKEETYTLHKVCQGHFKEGAKFNIRPKNIEREEKALRRDWESKQEIKSISTIREVTPALFRVLTINKHYDLYLNYTHIDNHPDCSFSYIKKGSIQDLCFESVIKQFESKIQSCNLNEDLEWGKLAKQVFGKNLLIVR